MTARHFSGSLHTPTRNQMEQIDYILVETAEELAAACERLGRATEVGFDTETTSLSPFEGRVRLVQLAAAGEPAYVFDLDALTGEGDNAPRRERARPPPPAPPQARPRLCLRPRRLHRRRRQRRPQGARAQRRLARAAPPPACRRAPGQDRPQPEVRCEVGRALPRRRAVRRVR